MERLFQPLLYLIPRCSRNELLRQIEFLQAENQLLRGRVPKKTIILKPEERKRLLELGKAVGPALRHLITIVSYGTFLKWRRDERNQAPAKAIGRRKTAAEIEQLVLKLARETGWGYTRILGELRKLGIQKISRQTVVNILKRAELEPGPRRGPGTWDGFLKMHAETLWQCDFFSKRVITRFGLRQVFALVFIHVGTRRVFVTPSTCKPDAQWVQDQTRAFFRHGEETGLSAKLIMRDRDCKYSNGFDDVAKSHGAEVRLTAFRSPNENAFVERFVQSIKFECLDHFLVFGEMHFDYLCREFVDYYHANRPHQGLDNRLIIQRPPPSETAPTVPVSQIECRKRLGGLLKSYHRAAA
ncbi:MAG: integrase core domain-containing protein [Pirellulales bacterium]